LTGRRAPANSDHILCKSTQVTRITGMKMNRTAVICGLMVLVACSVSAVGLKQKAQQGDPRAQYELGRRCNEQKNYRCALEWLRKAADQGHAGAQNRLGVMYERAEGVPMDLMEAYKWFTIAAAGGNTFAAANRVSLERYL